MANGNFVVHNGLTVGPLTIDATTGSITTTGNISTTGTTTTFINEIVTGTEAIYGVLTANAGTASTSTSTGTIIVTGGVGVSGAIYAGSLNTGSGSITTTGTVSATTLTGTLSTAAQTNITSVGTLSGLTVSAAIVPNSNVSINLGSTSAWWNILYGKATQAQYADLAENYQADSQYEPGTVVEFGGSAEVTIATEGTKRVAGVVSTNPAHLMNGGLSGANVIPLALQGRVPTKVIGPIKKGDLMIAAGFGYAKTNNDAVAGQIIGKALADFSGAKGVIEVVVGRQ
jgi:hypothetical protein